MKNLRILVTGADGFIGSHLVEALLIRGYTVNAFVLYNSFNSWGWLDNLDLKNRKNFNVFSGDIRDKQFVENLVKISDVVINLAALISIPYSFQSPQSFFDTNVMGCLNVLESCLKYKKKKLIQISTSEVYGKVQKVPIKENFAINAYSPYAASKISSDQLALSFYRSYDLPVVIIRPFNTYGPRQSARAIIPTILLQAINKEKINLGALHPTRDFTYISDTVNSLILAIHSKDAIGEVINIGSAFEISIKDLVNLISKKLNKKILVHKSKIRTRPSNSEVDRLLSSNTKAKKILKWRPVFSGLKGFEKGLKKTIEWFENEKIYKIYKSNRYNI